MNANFKPLGLAAAVATATAGYAGYANAQAASYTSASELGDLAIVPYYTVMDGYATGVNIINTANETQVIKFRFRRATDSMDALDFNVVLSPYDMYTGFISMKGDDIVWRSNDNSCSAPALCCSCSAVVRLCSLFLHLNPLSLSAMRLTQTCG